MGNRICYVKPIFNNISVQKDFFDYNIFEKNSPI